VRDFLEVFANVENCEAQELGYRTMNAEDIEVEFAAVVQRIVWLTPDGERGYPWAH
jgi:hypothetical protein